MSEKGADAIMTTMAPIHTKAEMAERERNIIKNGQNLLGIPSKKTSQGANRPPTFIHISQWLHQEHVSNFTGARFPLSLDLELLPHSLCEGIKHPKADIMPSMEIFIPWVPETDDAL
jgi:hypothetical protein